MAGFLEDILQSANSRLRPVETRVKTVTGAEYTERLTGGGVVTSQVTGASHPGYVVDSSPDLTVGVITNQLLIGSQDVADNMEILRSHGVSHIVNVGVGIPCWYPDHFHYLTLELYDNPEELHLMDVIAQAIIFIDNAHSQGGSVFIHCNAGVSRSAAVAIGYLIHTGSTFAEAYSLVKSKRPAIKPNEGFIKQLQTWKP